MVHKNTPRTATSIPDKVVHTERQRVSNNPSTTPIEVPTHLLPILEDALAIGRNTAMMSRGKEITEQIEELRLLVSQHVNKLSEQFNRYGWAAIFDRAGKGIDLTVTVESESTYWMTKTCWIEVSDPTGTKWPGFSNSQNLCSTEFEDADAAEEAASLLRDLIHKRQPMAE